MLDRQLKWWRWLGEESAVRRHIDRYESGNTYSSDIWRPSEHSMMRWLGNYFDQVGRERMTQRISGRRGSNAMSVHSTPTAGTVGPNEVLWVETGHPAYHELTVTWTRQRHRRRRGTANSRNLDARRPRPGRGRHGHARRSSTTPTFVRDPAVARQRRR